MSYIGNTNTTQGFTPAVDFFNGNGSTTAFTLSRPVASVAQVQAVISNVPQAPGTAYTVSGNTITFTSAPPSGTNNIYVYYTSPITQVTTLTQDPVITGNLNMGSTGARITGDFSNATIANRVAFQTSTANSGTYIETLPNGTSQGSGILVFNNSDPTDAAYMALTADASTAQVNASRTGTGAYLPMTFRTGGSERMRVDTSGNVGIGTVSPGSRLQVAATAAEIARYYSSSANGGYQVFLPDNNVTPVYVGSQKAILSTGNATDFAIVGTGANNMVLGTNSVERMRIDSSGNVLVGATGNPAAAKFFVAGTLAFGTAAAPEGQLTSDGTNAYLDARLTGGGLIFRTNGSSEKMRIDSSGNLLFNSGYGSVATAYGCRAWVNFNGTGTVAIRASGNVSSITDNGTGDYTVNFSTAMPDANYSSVASCSPSAGPNQRVVVMNFAGATNTIVAPTSSACRFSTSALAATADVEYVHFSAFR